MDGGLAAAMASDEPARKKRGADNQLTQDNWQAEDGDDDAEVRRALPRRPSGLPRPWAREAAPAARRRDRVLAAAPRAAVCRRRARISVVTWWVVHSNRGPSKRPRRTS